MIAASIGFMPVLKLGVVKAQFDPFFFAGGGQCFERILLVGSSIHDVEGGDHRLEHGKAFVVFGGYDDVAKAGVFGHAHPFFGIESRGVELLGDLFVVGNRDGGSELQPFANAVIAFLLVDPRLLSEESPVDE